MRFYSFDKTGTIKRAGFCPRSMFGLQSFPDEFFAEGQASDVTQKVVFDGLDQSGQPINPRIVEKQKVAQ